ncbi:MAG TPA: DUF2271 domain-containing protein [Polyangiaceae bacterium]
MIKPVSTFSALLAIGWLASTSACSSYVPEGQFWQDHGGPFTETGGASAGGDTSASAGASTSAGNNGVAGSADGNSAGSSLGGGDSAGSSFGGSNSAGSSFGGNNAAGSAFGGSNSNGGDNSSGGSSSGGSGSQSCKLSVTVTTTAPGGNYEPRNVGAIWIADSNGKFVKSLEVWGAQRLSRVVAWNAATKAAGASGNKVDAITSATLSSHKTHKETWNCTDYKEATVPDGNYRIYFEVADSNSGGPNIFETFTKGSSPATTTASMSNFQNITIAFTP